MKNITIGMTYRVGVPIAAAINLQSLHGFSIAAHIMIAIQANIVYLVIALTFDLLLAATFVSCSRVSRMDVSSEDKRDGKSIVGFLSR